MTNGEDMTGAGRGVLRGAEMRDKAYAVKIVGTGSYLPARIVTNSEIADRLGSSVEWIFSHTGISCRHVAGSDESAATMGAQAARSALAMAGVRTDDVGLIVLATTTPDYGSYPSTACLVQKVLGCGRAAAFDLSAACSGFVYGLEMARGWLRDNPSVKALVVGSEVLSRGVDWSDRSNAMLFGDGAGAVVLSVEKSAHVARHPGTDIPAAVSASVLGADGSGYRAIIREAGSRRALCADPVHETVRTAPVAYLKMDGHAVFAFAVRKLEEVIRELCVRASVEPASIDLVFAHQANFRIIDAVARRMKLPLSKFYLNLEHVGNTSSASIPICLDAAVREGVLRSGMRVAMAGFGSGLTWAGNLAQWPCL